MHTPADSLKGYDEGRVGDHIVNRQYTLETSLSGAEQWEKQKSSWEHSELERQCEGT